MPVVAIRFQPARTAPTRGVLALCEESILLPPAG